ncbi:MAG: hypothetical protein PVI70_10640 [Gammaproteobacteria bacterium]
MRILIFIFACLLPLANAIADHEADHRYQVYGYVLDKNEKAIPGREVTISADGELLARGKTDSYGYYSLHLHLHNEDRGRLLNLRAGPDRADIRVGFDPADTHTARVHAANLVGGKLVEKELNRWRTPPWIYPLAGFIVLGFLLVLLERRRKRKLRQKQFAHAPASRAKRGKKKRRKQH